MTASDFFKQSSQKPAFLLGGVACLVGGLAMYGFGQEDAPVEVMEEPTIPQAYPVERYLDVWLKSPFQLEAVGEVAAVKQSFARDYVLTGLIQDGDDSIAYIQNKKTGELKRLTTGETVDGLVLVSATNSPDPQAASIVVSQGSENDTLGYDEASFSQAAVQPVGYSPTGAAGNGIPGNATPPGQRPVIPNQPGAMPNRTFNSVQNPANAANGSGVVAPNDAAVNPAAMRLQQLKERQQQSAGPDSKSDPASRSRRRVLLPSASGQ